MLLNEIRDNPGARRKSKRLGRGEGSGKGKTCGRGTKGQKSRTGVSIKGFEGGQNPLYRRLPKRGFTNGMFRKVFFEVNLSDIQEAIDAKRLDPSQLITEQSLRDAAMIKGRNHGVKLLAKGGLNTAVQIQVDRASRSAIAVIESLKGKVILPA